MAEMKRYLLELEGQTANVLLEEQFSNREDAFTHYVLSQIGTKVSAENYVVCHASIKNSIGSVLGEIFAYNESANQEVLTLFYTIYETDTSIIPKRTDSDVQYAWARLQGFYDKAIRNAAEDMEKNDPAYEVCRMIDDNKNLYKTIRFYIISNCVIQHSEPKKIRIRDKETDNNIWDLKKLFGNLTDTSNHVEININLENDPDYAYKIPYIQMESTDHSEYKCLLMMFPAKLLYKLYRKWNTDLLQYNVRYWLSFKKTKRKHTNADIRETLQNNPQMFLAYNNGITAIASNVTLEPQGVTTPVGEVKDGQSTPGEMVSSGLLKAIHNFQIVNGGQTTASICKAKEAAGGKIDLSSTFVQVKLIVIGSNQNINELAGKISRSSNSQNAVKDSDFSVSEQFNTKMQELSRNIVIPNDRGELSYWYYERIRGQYEAEKTRLTKKIDADTFKYKYPRACLFTKEDIAIVWKSWKEEPSDAVKGRGTTYDIFINQIINDSFIPDEEYFKETIGLLILYKFLKHRPENKKYKNLTAPVIAYTLAYLHYITFDHFPLIPLWDNQKLSSQQELLLNKIANLIFQILSQLAAEEETSVLSMSKRKGLFEEIKQRVSSEDYMELRQTLPDIFQKNEEKAFV